MLIELTEKAIKECLDKPIRLWRQRAEEAKEASTAEYEAGCYLAAFQSVRVALFGELLEE